MRRLALLLLAGLVGSAAAAQGPRVGGDGDAAPAVRVADVAPGAVVTAVVVTDVQLAEGMTATYALTVAPGVRLFSAATGPVDALPGETVVVALTFAVDGGYPAGDIEIARLVVHRSDGTRTERAVVAGVQVRRRLTLALSADPPHAVAGGETRLSWRIANLGNAPDSVRLAWEVPPGWRVRPTDALVVLAPGAAREGEAVLGLSPDALPGQSGLVRAVAHGRSGDAQAALALTVQDDGPAWARLPGELVVGAGPDGPAVALHAEGRIAGDTGVQLTVRHAVGRVLAAGPGFDALGSVARVAVEAPDWAVALGEAPVGPLPLAGGPMSGVGADVRVRAGAGDLRVALLGAGIGGRASDRLALVEATSRGRHPGGLVLFAGERARPGGGAVAGGGFTWRLSPDPRHRLVADAGLLSVGSASGTAAGPSASVAYDYVDFRRSLSARLRHVPAAGATGEVMPQEASVGGRLSLPADVTLLGWGSATRLRRPGAPTAAADALTLGLDWAPGRARFGASGSVRQLSAGTIATDRRTVLVSAGYRVGLVRADLSADVGTVSSGDARLPTSSLRASALIVRGERSAWVALLRQADGSGTRLLADLGASLPGRRLTLDGGLTAAAIGPRLVPSGWARAAVPVGGGWDVLGAFRATPGAASDLSVALRRRLRVPVLARPDGAAWGRVYDDRNGNGRLDDDEPGLPGVIVRAGALVAVTGADGRWTLGGAATQGRPVAIDGATLPVGFVLPGAVDAPAEGRVDLPVIRAATLTLDVYEDYDDDGLRGPREPGLTGALVRVEDAAGGVRWSGLGADGRATITGLPPGRLRVTVHIPARGPRRASEEPFVLFLEPGEAGRLEVPAGPSARRIRFGG